MKCRTGAGDPCPDHDCFHALKGSAKRGVRGVRGVARSSRRIGRDMLGRLALGWRFCSLSGVIRYAELLELLQSLLAIVIVDVVGTDNSSFGRTHRPFPTIRKVAGFPDRVICHDVDD